MGLCVSCKKSKERFKGHCGNNKEFVGFLPAKSAKICNEIPTVVPNHETKRCVGSVCLNRQSSGSPRSETMAASFSNMNLTNPIKGLVSKNRNRYKQDGFNLDLTYITDSIIAMGYPASNIESVYRNNIEDVVKFLDQKHPNHYMIYNLCSERSYDKSKFHNMVTDFPFDDHNPPKIESVEPFCQNMKEWLEKDPKNVAVVHCKAGKGRTGTMICCYLLHSRRCSSADQALSFYGGKRTHDTKGVTIPSQVRYVRYYEQLVNHRLRYSPITLYITEFIFDPVPTFMSGPGNLSFTVSESISGDKLNQRFKSDFYKIPVDAKSFSIRLDRCFRLQGDIKIQFYNKTMMRKDKLFHFWFNTFFVGVLDSADLNGYDKQSYGVQEDGGFKLVFRKNELDKLNKKDKQHKIFNENFKLTMVVQKISTPNHGTLSNYSHGCQSVPDTTPSESSAGSSDESDEDEWDSVLEDLIAGLTSNRLIKDLMKPQTAYSHDTVRDIIETIANSSSMKLDTVSMNKLWDLITMVFKWQLAMSSAVIETSQRHLYEIESYVASEGTQLQLHRVQNILDNFNKVLSNDEKTALYEDLTNWCQSFNVRVSLLLRMGLQDNEGHFLVNNLDPLAEKMLQNIGENIYESTQNGRILEANSGSSKPTSPKTENVNELKCFVDEMLGERKLSTGSSDGNPNLLRLSSLTESKLNNNADDRFDSINVNLNDNDKLQSLMTDLSVRDDAEQNSFKDDLLSMIEGGQSEVV